MEIPRLTALPLNSRLKSEETLKFNELRSATSRWRPMISHVEYDSQLCHQSYRDGHLTITKTGFLAIQKQYFAVALFCSSRGGSEATTAL